MYGNARGHNSSRDLPVPGAQEALLFPAVLALEVALSWRSAKGSIGNPELSWNAGADRRPAFVAADKKLVDAGVDHVALPCRAAFWRYGPSLRGGFYGSLSGSLMPCRLLSRCPATAIPQGDCRSRTAGAQTTHALAKSRPYRRTSPPTTGIGDSGSNPPWSAWGPLDAGTTGG
jgi:hypothetical protein